MKWPTLKLLFGVIWVLTIVLWGSSGQAAIETTIEKIVADKNAYDGKEVSVSGTTSRLNYKTSKDGNVYTTFSLVGDTGGRINVFVRQSLKVQGGLKVRVTGTYHKVKKVGKYTFRNEIEATEITIP